MALETLLNPDGYDEAYLAHLNTCFGHWGDEALFDWAFRRSAGSFSTDRMILNEESETLAGSAVSYRKVTTSRGRSLDVGIMSGSWTLPAARGRGCFTRIIQESLSLTGRRGGAMLLAFVTHDNPSCHALRKAGSVMYETSYVLCQPDEAPAGSLDVSDATMTIDALWRAIESSRTGTTHFAYPTAEDFAGQFSERALPTQLLQVGDAVAVVEKAADTDRVIAMAAGDEDRWEVYRAVAANAAQDGRAFFAFVVGRDVPPEFGSKDGFLTVLAAAGDPSRRESGVAVTDLGPWHIDSGDRM